MQSISILGCGWLGLPLAKHLIQKKFKIRGSTTSGSKISQLEAAGIEAFVISLLPESISGDFETFLQKSKTLIIDIPPKLRGENSESFVEKIKTFVQKGVVNSEIENVLFISSTSVYGDDAVTVTEETLEKPTTQSGKELLETEHFLQQQTTFKTTILRFGGLTGETRNPAKSLAEKKNITSPEAPINLIHQEDCIAIITEIIEQNLWGEKLNAVAPYHPSRKDYYCEKAEQLSLPLPEFEENNASGKIIDSSKLIEKLKYKFIHMKDI